MNSPLHSPGTRPDHLSPLIAACMIAALLSACQPSTAPSTGPGEIAPTLTPVQVQPATPTPFPTADTRTPPELPGIFTSERLNPLDRPRAYVEDACQNLQAKWDSHNAPPGTVVMIVMLHSIYRGAVPNHNTDGITVLDLIKMVEELHKQDFQAINTQQLADFLEHNAKIPSRSVVLLQDGRRFAENFDKRFRPYWEEWGWPVVNAWDVFADSSENLWEQNIALEKEGFVDHQVYGPQVTAGSDKFSDQYWMDEFQKPFTAFQDRFDKAPIAVVWPGGFGPHSAQIARETGYRLGFTQNSRGPVMFNWVPLADQMDNLRPSYAPEAAVDDPLMTLPRYWPYQVYDALDPVRLIGREAAAYAEQNRAVELEYYDIVCAPDYGPIQ